MITEFGKSFILKFVNLFKASNFFLLDLIITYEILTLYLISLETS